MVMYNVLPFFDSLPRTLFPPARHSEMVKQLYEPLGLRRLFSLRRGVSPVGMPDAGCADQTPGSTSLPRGLSLEYRRKYGVYNYQILPSQIEQLSSVTSLLAEAMSQGKRVFIRVALNDEFCPDICGSLESIGLRFCGVISAVGRYDFIVYSRFTGSDLKRLALYSKRAQALSRYLQAAV